MNEEARLQCQREEGIKVSQVPLSTLPMTAVSFIKVRGVHKSLHDHLLLIGQKVIWNGNFKKFRYSMIIEIMTSLFYENFPISSLLGM